MADDKHSPPQKAHAQNSAPVATVAQASTIAAVERDTGLAKDTLRVWERRYGFPTPVRDSFGERIYPPDQVEKLRLLRHLLDQGHRPGKIVALDIPQLQDLIDQGGRTKAKPVVVDVHEELQGYIDLCRDARFEQLREVLWEQMQTRGLQRFVTEIAAPLNSMIGDLWARGSFAVFEEHLYTESMQAVLRGGIALLTQSSTKPATAPLVLLTTFPQEEHGLGLLMAEALLSLQGARCMNLGVRMPITEIARAAITQKADIVALSFSAAMNPNQMANGARDLRAVLPKEIEIWAGGACAGLRRRPPPELKVLNLVNIDHAIADWRTRHAV